MGQGNFYLGYRPKDLQDSPLAGYFRPDMAPLSPHAREGVLIGGQSPELFPDLSEAPSLLDPGYWPVETGYSACPDGSARIFALTPMPGVEPAMWDWWFGWHGDEALKYKLWHPRAHVHVAWADGEGDLGRYVGRTSKVVEYVGASRLDLTIRFVPPASLGLDEARLAAQGEVAICARGGLAGAPVETGWLIHHLRPTADGCEMRSRFWLGGPYIRPRGMAGPLGVALGAVAARLSPLSLRDAGDLLVHCSQEMTHLAAILPDLYADFGPRTQD